MLIQDTKQKGNQPGTPKLASRSWICSAASLPPTFDLTGVVVSKKSPLTIQRCGRSLSRKRGSWKTKIHCVVALQARKRDCESVDSSHYPIFLSVTLVFFSVFLLFSFLFLPLFSCLVWFPRPTDRTSRRPSVGRRRKALFRRASDSRSSSLPHSPQSQGGGPTSSLEPGPCFCLRQSGRLDQGVRFSAEPQT